MSFSDADMYGFDDDAEAVIVLREDKQIPLLSFSILILTDLIPVLSE